LVIGAWHEKGLEDSEVSLAAHSAAGDGFVEDHRNPVVDWFGDVIGRRGDDGQGDEPFGGFIGMPTFPKPFGPLAMSQSSAKSGTRVSEYRPQMVR